MNERFIYDYGTTKVELPNAKVIEGEDVVSQTITESSFNKVIQSLKNDSLTELVTEIKNGDMIFYSLTKYETKNGHENIFSFRPGSLNVDVSKYFMYEDNFYYCYYISFYIDACRVGANKSKIDYIPNRHIFIGFENLTFSQFNSAFAFDQNANGYVYEINGGRMVIKFKNDKLVYCEMSAQGMTQKYYYYDYGTTKIALPAVVKNATLLET